MIFDFVKSIQTDLLLFLAGACGVLLILIALTKTLRPVQKGALLRIEMDCTLLLIFDRFAYLYSGDVSDIGYTMVRVTNFAVFFLSLIIAHDFTVYLIDLYQNKTTIEKTPTSLIACEFFFTVGSVLLIISQFTGLYYYFDENNRYHRGPAFIVSYIFPFLIMTIQLIIVIKYRKHVEKMEFIPILLFSTIPYIASITQIFTYGLSLTNMSIVGMAIMLYIFEIKNMNTLAEKKRQAEEANTSKSRFLTNISHELRTPINTIMGMGEMIVREDASDVPLSYYKNITNYAKDIEEASDSLLCLVNDILDISQIESGKMYLDEVDYSLEDMIRELVSYTRMKTEKKELNFDVNIEEALPKKLFGDKVKVKRILQTLLNNAVQYTSEGRILFKVIHNREGEDLDCLTFTVEDTGIGLKPEEVENLFSAFNALDVVKNSTVKGIGLGLDISKYFAELMGGEIHCESEYGVGSTFTVVLKQRIVDATPIGKFQEVVDAPARGAYQARFIAPDASILVVDDNPMNLSVIKGLLSATRMYIVLVESGEACLEKLKENDYDLILLDHMMPGMDGIETLERIRKTHKDLPVIALTANYISNGDEFYKSKGFDGYLAKPVEGVVLEKAIRKFLPDDMVMDRDVADIDEDAMVLPEEYEWLSNVEGINVEDGIKYSGGVEGFIFSIKMFFDSIHDNLDVIQKAFEDGDYKFYTVKVHALKSNARIIGAEVLSKLAKSLEDAGNQNDVDFIKANNQALIQLYKSYKEKLQGLHDKKDSDDGKELIPEEDLQEAYEAIKSLTPSMDYDSIEMVINQVKEYRVPDDQKEKVEQLERALKKFDWDKLEEILQS